MIATVVFNPMSGVARQEQTVTISFTNDEIALEDDEVISFYLNNSVGTTLVHPSAVDLVVKDDDSKCI